MRLDDLWSALDGDPALVDRVRLTGPDQVFSAAFDVTTLATVTVAAATLAVAEFGARRTGQAMPEVTIDRFEAAAAFCSESLLRPLDWELPPLWDPIAGVYPAADGWIRLHTNYAHHRAAALRALEFAAEAEPDRESVADRVAKYGADELEQRVVAEGGCAAQLRTAPEWASHPHGRFACKQAAITFTRGSGLDGATAGDVGPGLSGVAGSRAGDGPLAGIRVLDLTRVMAGPVCTRTLAAWGADVLRIDPPGFVEVPVLLPDMTVGKHCAAIDLLDSRDRATFELLIGQADVIVHGLRPGALAGLGYGDDVLRLLNPALCIATVDAYGWAGPWADRRGFDSLVQFSCGIAAARGAAAGSVRPVPLPAQALDHGTGYLLAAAICRGLTGQQDGLAPADIRAALVGTANLLSRQPLSSPVQPTPDCATATQLRATAWGPVMAVPTPGAIGGASGAWRIEAGPLGRHPPEFAESR
jgi:crotonobetainyl-CoA:carnitine CoA-transferase CaiB-like acyl-CoA transferase